VAPGTWEVASTSILSAKEVLAIVEDLKRRGKRSINSQMNLVIFRLATGCGLRASEIAGITVGDVRLSSHKPHILIRKSVGKGGRKRQVPLWWDQATLDDITAWKSIRKRRGKASPDDPFVCTLAKGSAGNRLHRNAVRNRFLNACKVLGHERLKALTVHSGRHTFISHALKHRTLAEVRQAAGHTNIATTSVYLHVAVEDDGQVGKLFD